MSILEIPPTAFAALAAAVFVGALVQRLSGQGYGMIASPITALVAPQHLPSTIILLGLVVGAGALSMDLSAVNWREARPGMAGRSAGGFAGAALALVLTSRDAFGVVVALIVLFAVGLSISGLRVQIRSWSLALAGFTAGVMGTMTAIGAPPMALLYQYEEAIRSRAMQNLFFVWGMVWSILALSIVGLIGWADLLLASLLAPFTVAALFLSRPLARRLAGRSLRPAALSIAALAALLLLARSIA